jgi:integrase
MSSTTRLTKQAVERAAQAPRRYIVWDTELKGFGLRVSEQGTKTYVLRYRPRGMGVGAPKRFMVLGRHGAVTPDQARTQAKAILGQVASGSDPAAALRKKGLTVSTLAQRFLDEHVRAKRKKTTSRDYTALLNNHFVTRFGRHLAESVTTADLSNLHLSLKARPYVANRLVAVVGSMYGFAERRGLVAKGSNPAKGTERFREQSRERFLGAGELRRLGDTLRLAETSGLPWKGSDNIDSKYLPREKNQRTVFPSELILAFRLLLFTGARLREILTLEWQHVDLERGLIFLPDNKSGRKTIVMSAPVLELFRGVNRVGRYVIPGADRDHPRSDLKKPWDAIQRQAGLEGVRIHDLRHTFASIGAVRAWGSPLSENCWVTLNLNNGSLRPSRRGPAPASFKHYRGTSRDGIIGVVISPATEAGKAGGLPFEGIVQGPALYS